MNAGVSEVVLRFRQRTPDRTAIDLGDSTISYGELGRMVDHLASRLRAEITDPSELLLLATENEAALLVGALAAGAARRTFAVVRRAMPEALVRKQFARLKPGLLLTGFPGAWLPDLKRIKLDLLAIRKLAAESPSQRAGCEAPAEAEREVDSAPFCIIVGSGSTGTPKLFEISQAGEVLNLRQRIEAFSLSPDDQVASLIQSEFTSSWRLLAAGLAAGAMLRLHPRSAPSWMDELMSSEVSILLAPVVGLHSMLQRYGGLGRVLPSLRRIATVGSDVSEDLRHQIHERLTPSLHVIYATNEMGYFCIAGPDDWLNAPGTVGRLLPGLEMEVVDQQGDPVQAGEPGLLRFRKPHMPIGYIGNPEMTRRHFKEGWFYPGDVGRIDAEGRLILLGRADDMMIYNGINIYPSEIESTLRKFPGVRDVAAVLCVTRSTRRCQSVQSCWTRKRRRARTRFAQGRATCRAAPRLRSSSSSNNCPATPRANCCAHSCARCSLNSG